jgi:hypothetical protein
LSLFWQKFYSLHFSSAYLRQGSKSAKFFSERTGGAILAKVSEVELSGAAVTSKKFGAVERKF